MRRGGSRWLFGVGVLLLGWMTGCADDHRQDEPPAGFAGVNSNVVEQRCEQGPSGQNTDLEEVGGNIGFAPAVVLARTVGRYSTTLAGKGGIFAPQADAARSTALFISLEYHGGRVELWSPLLSSPEVVGGELRGDPVRCKDSYKIEALLRIRSADGSLDEIADVTLTADNPYEITFVARIPREALRGSLRDLPTDPPGGVLDLLSVSGTASTLGTRGSLVGSFTFAGDERVVAAASMEELGAWPSDNPCEGLRLPVAADADLGGFTLQDGMAALNGRFPRPLVWRAPESGAAVMLPPWPVDEEGNPLPAESIAELEALEPQLTAQGETQVRVEVAWPGAEALGCARFEGTSVQFEHPVAVVVASEGGRWDARYGGTLSGKGDRTGPRHLRLRVQVGPVPIAETAEQLGIGSLNPEGYQDVRMRLSFDDDARQGELRVRGGIPFDCLDALSGDRAAGATGTADCGGPVTLVTLLGAEF